MAAKPRHHRKNKFGLGAGDKFGEVRTREKGLSWCRSVWGDGGQRTHVTTGARDRRQHLCVSLSRNEKKRHLKCAVQATVPSKERETDHDKM